MSLPERASAIDAGESGRVLPFAPAVFHKCFGVGCPRLAWPREPLCRRCQEENEALDAAEARSQNPAEGKFYAAMASPAAQRVMSFVWFSAAVAAMSLLLMMTAPFWLEWLHMIAKALGEK